MLISVVINNFNYARFVGQAVQSALDQDYPEKEIIVVDDGSTDGSSEVITRFGSAIRTHFQSNGGQASALNAGFALSHGEIVLFLDADDLLQPGALTTVAKNWDGHFVKMHWRLAVVDVDGLPTGAVLPNRKVRLTDGVDFEEVLRTGQSYAPPTSGNAYSRRLLQTIMPIPAQDFRICADGYLNRIAAFRGPIKLLPEICSCYRLHGANSYAGSKLRKLFDSDYLRRQLTLWARYRALLMAEASRAGQTLGEDYEPSDHEHIRDLFLARKVAGLKSTPNLRLLSLGWASLWRDPALNLPKKLRASSLLLASALMPGVMFRRVGDLVRARKEGLAS